MFLQFTEVVSNRKSEHLYSEAKEHYAAITEVTLDDATTIFTTASGNKYAVPFKMPVDALELFKNLSTGMRLGPDHMVLRVPCYQCLSDGSKPQFMGGKTVSVMAGIASHTRPVTDSENASGYHAATEAHVEKGYEPYVR